MRPARLFLVACALPIVFATACQSVPPIELRSGIRPSSDYDAVNPSDIVILPVEDATTDRSLTPYARSFRRDLTEGLVERLYSPLAPDHVDRILAEAGQTGMGSPVDPSWLGSLAGSFQADALLGIQVTRWDVSRIDQTDQVDFSLEVLMIGAESKERLWSGRAEGRVKAGGAGPAPIGHEAKIESAIDVLADSLARELPIRRLGGS